jgi:hypothetical protein
MPKMQRIMKYKYLVVGLNFTIRFKMNLKESRYFPFKEDNKFKLINPAYYLDTDFQFNDEIYVIGDKLIFLTTIDDVDLENLSEFLSVFLKAIRYTSKQVSINYYNSISTISLKESLKFTNIVRSENVKAIALRKSYFDTFITRENIRTASKIIFNKLIIPVYDDILLDAISGLGNEPRKSILFAYVSMESMLSIELDKIYKDLLKNKKHKHLRIIKHETPSGEVYKDPIFSFFQQQTNFSNLLHLMPLYLLKRSLMVEDKILYDAALKLYKTRNKIAHLGGTENLTNNQDDYLPIDDIGALRSINTAIKIFNWFGLKHFSPLDQLDAFVKLGQ